MARKTITHTEYTDDIDGGAAAGTVTFAYDGANYEIDLSKANARAFEKAVKPYVEAARKVRGTKSARTNKATVSDRDLNAIRAWARSNGYEIADRGRVAGAILEAYDAAN